MIIVVFHVIKKFLYIETRNHIPLPVQLRDHDIAHDFHAFFGMTVVMHVRITLAFSPALRFRLSDIVQQRRFCCFRFFFRVERFNFCDIEA